MIIGLGQDIVDTRRIAHTLRRFGQRFEQRVFTDAEQEYARSSLRPEHAYARRFAVKEACSKALGSGIGHCGVSWRDIEIVPVGCSLPASLRLHRGARTRLEAITPVSARGVCHVSTSDDPPYAVAVVIIEAVTDI